MVMIASLPVTAGVVSGAAVRMPTLKSRRARLAVVRADAENGTSSTAVADAPSRRPSPLQRGGTLSGAAAAGKDASDKFKAMAEGKSKTGPVMSINADGYFKDFRWQNGRWDLTHPAFKAANGVDMDWDAVIDAEMARRKLLEDTPIPSTNEDPVLFDTGEIPWWAWVRRFHLPEAEKLNGRAAMVGYFLALVVDQLSGAGLLDQQNSFLGKVALHISVFGILLFRSTGDIEKYKNLLDEAFFYDSQWKQGRPWANQERPSETEN